MKWVLMFITAVEVPATLTKLVYEQYCSLIMRPKHRYKVSCD